MRVFVLVFACLAGMVICRADELAAVTGLVTDANGRSVPGVTILITNLSTKVAFRTVTNDQGIYRVPSLQPGIYRITVDKDGFKSIVKSGVELHVQDVASINFELQVGSVNETVTVEAGALVINTTDAAVSTVIDRDFVANIPLNGRSLQSLISLAPGVLVVPDGRVGAQGEFSVNGQRTEANYFTVDGVSANTGSNPLLVLSGSAGPAGGAPGETALGTTQSMISLDALQEFRATTSTYSAEYGRTPGGQFSFVSRGGANDWHGSVFDYFRNEALDANNWFSDALGIRKTPERQNDFGGTVGGPVRIPGLYNGKDKTFFFFSYEGLRLQLPAGGTTDQYPDMTLRQNAPAVLQPYLNAFPVPNGPEVLDPTTGQATGLALFTAAYSNPYSLDSISIRMDHNLSGSMKIFGRYSGSPSSSSVRQNGADLAQSRVSSVNVKSLTLGATNTVSSRLNNDFRFNYTRNNGTLDLTVDNFGGARPFTRNQAPGIAGASGFFQFTLNFGGGPSVVIGPFQDAQQQWNVTDAFTVSHGSHNLKFGIDYRRLATYVRNDQLDEFGLFSSNTEVLQNAPDFVVASSIGLVPPQPIYTNFSAYAQDEWRA